MYSIAAQPGKKIGRNSNRDWTDGPKSFHEIHAYTAEVKHTGQKDTSLKLEPTHIITLWTGPSAKRGSHDTKMKTLHKQLEELVFEKSERRVQVGETSVVYHNS